MARTPHLKLPLLAPAQAQKHVTVNEAMDALDAVAHCAVLGRDRDDPPADAAEGDRWLIGAAPTGAWALEAGNLAWWSNGGWAFASPAAGWRVYDLSDDTLYALSAARTWTPISGGAPADLQSVDSLGIGTAADANNPFAAKLNSGLWTARTPAEGGSGDLFLTLNKTDPARDAGYVFQTGFVTRALAGLFGSNRFRVAVSPDGATFRDALTVNETSGIVDQPHLPRFKAHTNFDNFAPVDTWIKIGINTVETNDQAAFNPATNCFVAPTAGVYMFGASLMFKLSESSTARMRGRLMLNGATQINGSFGENSGPHASFSTAMWLQTLAPLAQGDTVELQGSYRVANGFFLQKHTTFWGFKVG